jgi:hypothetical protein
MVTPAQRISARRQDRLPTRAIRLGLDGVGVTVEMTKAEERQLRAKLQPFLRHARAVQLAEGARSNADPVELSDQLRNARITALLGLSSTGKGGSSGQPALDLLVQRTAEVYARSLCEETRRTYRRRWLVFAAWCEQRRLQALPADPTTLMLYLADLAGRDPQPSLSTLRGMANAINRVHLEHDVAVPGDDTAVSMLMRGLSHAVHSPQVNPITALRVEELRVICRHLDHPDAVVVRDAAIVRLALAGVPNGIIARLRWPEVRFDRDKVLLGERLAKNGSVVGWRTVPALPDVSRCPVAALQRWRSIAGTTPAVLFTQCDRDGRRGSKPLGPAGIRYVIRNRLDSLGPQKGKTELATVADLLHDVATDVLRDRALLLLGFAMAARRGELTRLVWDDIRFVDEGLIVRIRHSKTDLDGRGTSVGIPHGRSALTCPVRAVQAWRDRMQQQLAGDFSGDTGVFPKIGKAGRITPEQPLSNEGLTMVVKRRAEAAGITGHWGGRSLRAGLISSCADLDIPLELIALQSRHTSLDSLVRYVRTEDVFRRNAAERVGL